jgi:hypothetical protein
MVGEKWSSASYKLDTELGNYKDRVYQLVFGMGGCLTIACGLGSGEWGILPPRVLKQQRHLHSTGTRGKSSKISTKLSNLSKQ